MCETIRIKVYGKHRTEEHEVPAISVPCPDCKGSGFHGLANCLRCGDFESQGSGRLRMRLDDLKLLIEEYDKQFGVK